MKKKAALVILFMVLAAFSVFGAVTATTKVDSPALNMHPGDTNQLVFTLSISATSPDVLTSFECANAGTADEPSEIAAVKLWYQPAAGVFNPATAVFVGVLSQVAAKDWINTSLNLPVSNGGALYVTLDISAAPVNAKTARFKVSRDFVAFATGGTFPAALLQNTTSQITENPGYLLAAFDPFMPAKADAGLVDVYAGKMTFRNSLAAANMDVTSLRLQSVNYAGGVNASASLLRVTVKNGATTYANFSAMPVSNTVNVPLTTNIVVPPGGAAVTADIFITLLSSINTYDFGLRIPQPADIITAANNTVVAYSGYSFPFLSGRAVITQPNNTVNAFHQTTMPAAVSKGQDNIKPFVLRFAHPQSVTTFADCIVKGVTLTVLSNPPSNASAIFDRARLSDGAYTYADTSSFAAANTVWLPFSRSLTISAGTYMNVTLLVDVKAALSISDFYMSLSKTSDVWSVSGSTGLTQTAVMASSLTSTAAIIQEPATGINLHHVNKMPQYAAKGQAWVNACDFIFSHPDTGAYASVEIKGVTITVENEAGAGIIPNSVIKKITVLDSLSNTKVSFSSLPASDNKIYLDFTNSLILPQGGTETLKFYLEVTGTTSELTVKLNVNSQAAINALDYNSKVPLSAAADFGDAFPMKTSAAQIVNPAVDVKINHTDTMPVKSNSGQIGVQVMLFRVLNNSGGVVSVDKLQLRVLNQLGNPVSAASYMNGIRIDNYSNTAQVFYSAAVTTTSSVLDMSLSSPVVVAYNSAVPLTIAVRVNIADPAAAQDFRLELLSSAGVTAKDYNIGSVLPVIANGGVFPMASSLTHIEARAQTLNVSHLPQASGPVAKGAVGIEVMEFSLENPGNLMTSSVTVSGITLTAENGTGAISAVTAFSRISIYEKGNPANLYGQLTSIPASQLLYINFTNPIHVTAVASALNITFTVAADISSFATAVQFRLNLSGAQNIAAIDSNQGLPVTVLAKSPDTFPNMRSNLINIQASNKMKVLHENTMPARVSNGQAGVNAATFRFSNTTDNPIAVHGITLTVEDSADIPVTANNVLTGIRILDDNGNTNAVISAMPASGSEIYITFTQNLDIDPSSYSTFSVLADVKDNTYTSAFKLSLSSAAMVDALPNTIIVEADSGHIFPMKTSAAQVQLKPVSGGIAHSDVIPTTVSTGQTDIFAEIITIQNPNPPLSADILLSGITLTVEDDTNTAINPATAIKKIMVRGASVVNTFFTAIPSAPGSFYVPFDIPASVSPSATSDLKLYIDIVDTLQAGTFRVSIKINNDVRFNDANSGNTLAAAAINGDAFPMNTSTVIIQEHVNNCLISHNDIIPPSVNKGQQGLSLLALNFNNPGSLTGANMAITRIVISVENSLNAEIIPKNALSRLYVRDSSGVIYGDVTAVPDFGGSVSIGLTTPITVQPGDTKQVFITGDINLDAVAAGFKTTLKSAVNIIARDANSYEIVTVSPLADSFPMRSSYAIIQAETKNLQILSGNLMPAAVNKSQTGVPALYLEPANPNAPGYSSARIEGVTITVMNNAGLGIIPSAVLTKLEIKDSVTTYGSQAVMPSSGSKVYVPFSTPVNLTAAGSKGVTLYADIASVTGELYLMLGVENQPSISALEINSGSPVTVIAGTYPLRSSYAVILSTPGIKAGHIDMAPGQVTAGQSGMAVMEFEYSNVGSFAEQIRYITMTVKNLSGAPEDVTRFISAMYAVDGSGNTRAANSSLIAGSKVLLDLGGAFLTVAPQGINRLHIYADLSAATFTASYYFSSESALDVSSTAAVSAKAPDVYPMDTKIIQMQKRTPSVIMASSDLMPPTVSTLQTDAFTMMLSVSNTGSAGSSSVLLTGLTITVKDALSNTFAANRALSGIKVTDLASEYIHVLSIPQSEHVFLSFPQPVTIASGEVKYLYITADIISTTANAAGSFKITLSSAASAAVFDYNDPEAAVLVSGIFPMESSAALIQKKAVQLKVSHQDTMPLSVSTDQLNVASMKIFLTDSGDTSTASVMVTRINLYVTDELNAAISPQDSVKAVRIASEDGLITYGEALSFSGSKVSINLTAPLIVSTSNNVTVTARVDIASSAVKEKFKLSINAASDTYSIDANSFELVAAANALPDVFPMRSGAASISPKASAASLDNLTQLMPAALYKSQKRAGLFAFKLSNPMATGAAKEIFRALTITVRDNLDNEISAAACVENFYLVDGNSNTVCSGAAGVGSRTALFVPSGITLTSGSYIYLTLYADILPSASAQGFKACLESSADISIQDINSGYETLKNASPALPWRTTYAPIYNAPATNLHVWHDGTLIPGLSGKGQNNVRLMAVNLSNPGSLGSANVTLEGVSVTACDIVGNTLVPSSIVEGYKISDYLGLVTYGYVTASAINTALPVYIDFFTPYQVEASNTKTVYISADIADNAAAGAVYFRITGAGDIAAHNDPTGSITVTAASGDSFPLASNMTTITAVTYFVNVGFTDLMPVSAAKGDQGVNAMQFSLANINNTAISLTGLTITVKDRDGNAIAASSVIDSASLMDGAVLAASAAATVSSYLYFVPGTYSLAANSTGVLTVSVNISSAAAQDFYLELETASEVSTSPAANIQPAAGNQFGSMKSGAVSIQQASTEESFHSFPNPFNPETEEAAIEYYLPNASKVTIKIYTLEGRLVRVIADNADKTAGLHFEDKWDAKNGDKAKVRSGVYMCVLDIYDNVSGIRKKHMRKMVVLR